MNFLRPSFSLMRPLAAVVLLAATALPGHAALQIASWNLAGQPGNQVSTPGQGFELATANPITRGPGLSTVASPGSFNSTAWSTDAGDYVSFGFTVAAGYEVDLASLLLGSRSTADGPVDMAIYCSVDNFAAPVATFTSGNVFLNSEFDLSALTGLSGTVEFRIRTTGVTPAPGGFRLTNFFLNNADTGSIRFTGTVRATTPGAPAINFFTPSAGPAGTTVTITGQNLDLTDDVWFNETPASFQVVNATTLTATVPASATTGHLRVENINGVAYSASVFTVPQLRVELPATITEGQTALGTVRLPFPATEDVFVTLASSSPGDLTVNPTLVLIPAGFDFADFDLIAPPDGVVDPSVPVTITATADAYLDGSSVITVLNADAPAIFAAWEVNGLSNFGPSPFAATTVGANVTAVGLTRGPGIGISGTAGNSAWGGSNWAGQADLASAVTAGAFVTFSVTGAPGYTFSLYSISPYNIRRSSSGPTTGQWQYNLNDGEYVNIGSPITWGSVTNASGNPQAELMLATIPALQNLPGGTKVGFRLVNYGASGTGTWYINNLATAGNDLVVNGVITADNPDAPTITASTTSLPALTPTPEGLPSAAQSFTVSASNLTTGITINAPTGFEVSVTPGGTTGYAASQNLPAPGGTVTDAPVFVRLSGQTAGSFSGNVTLASTGATTLNVGVTGRTLTVVSFGPLGLYRQGFSTYAAATPDLPTGWASIGLITGFPSTENTWGVGTSAGARGGAFVYGYQHTGTTGVLQQVLSVRNDTGGLLDTLYVRYEGRVARIAETRSPAYTVTVNGVEQPALSYSTETGENQTITTQLTGLAIPAGGVFQIVWTSDANVGTSGSRRQIGIGAFALSTAPVADPQVGVTGSFTPFSTTQGSPSAAQSVTVSGSNLFGPIVVTPPTGYQASLDNVTFASSVSVADSGGNVSPTPVYVRIAASAPVGTPAGFVTVGSSGATSTELVVTGTVTASGFASWGAFYGLTGGNALAGADPDGDGFNNAAEFAFGTNPTQGNPGLVQASRSGSNLVVSWIQRNSGVSYQPQSLGNLQPGQGTWAPAGVTVEDSADQTGLPPAEAGAYTRKQFTVPATGQTFYRILSTQ